MINNYAPTEPDTFFPLISWVYKSVWLYGNSFAIHFQLEVYFNLLV